MRTVFHVSDVEAYRAAETKVRNLFDDSTVAVDAVAVVVDSGAVVAAAAETERATTGALAEMGATVKVCSNAARGATAGQDDFGEGVEFVSSGVGELTRLQNRGWAYIRL